MACDGTASLSVVGSSPLYDVLWDNGQTDALANGLCSGPHSYTLTDAYGCNYIYHFQVGYKPDLLPPIVLLNAQASAALGPDGTLLLDPWVFDAGSVDYCGIASFTADPAFFSCNDLGANNVFITVTDYDGNSSGGWVELLVVDTLGPVLICPPSLYTGDCQSAPSFDDPGFTDNCSSAAQTMVQTAGLPSGSTFPFGTTIQEFMATDDYGNTGVCSFEIHVEGPPAVESDIISPTLPDVCNGSITLTPIGQVLPYTFAWGIGESGPEISNLCPDAYTVTITDASGCTSILDIPLLVGNHDPGPLARVQIFPNPAAEFAFIQTNGINEPYALSLSDATGRILMEAACDSGAVPYRLDLSEFPSGLLFVKIRFSNKGDVWLRLLRIAH
ncbi:MAG: HYR domain-containing protein [Lewinellaceae bacterium]|nr:HYR domain-containing protein [Lewinellaceae bacterium]